MSWVAADESGKGLAMLRCSSVGVPGSVEGSGPAAEWPRVGEFAGAGCDSAALTSARCTHRDEQFKNKQGEFWRKPRDKRALISYRSGKCTGAIILMGAQCYLLRQTCTHKEYVWIWVFFFPATTALGRGHGTSQTYEDDEKIFLLSTVSWLQNGSGYFYAKMCHHIELQASNWWMVHLFGNIYHVILTIFFPLPNLLIIFLLKF
jgi:hypothetical protein